MKYNILKKLSQAEYNKLSGIVYKEIEEIRACLRWANAWWTPDYLADRILGLYKEGIKCD